MKSIYAATLLIGAIGAAPAAHALTLTNVAITEAASAAANLTSPGTWSVMSPIAGASFTTLLFGTGATYTGAGTFTGTLGASVNLTAGSDTFYVFGTTPTVLGGGTLAGYRSSLTFGTDTATSGGQSGVAPAADISAFGTNAFGAVAATTTTNNVPLFGQSSSPSLTAQGVTVVDFAFESLGANAFTVGGTTYTYAGEYVVTVAASAVPEPASLVLFGVGLAGLAFVARRRMAGSNAAA